MNEKVLNLLCPTSIWRLANHIQHFIVIQFRPPQSLNGFSPWVWKSPGGWLDENVDYLYRYVSNSVLFSNLKNTTELFFVNLKILFQKPVVLVENHPRLRVWNTASKFVSISILLYPRVPVKAFLTVKNLIVSDDIKGWISWGCRFF